MLYILYEIVQIVVENKLTTYNTSESANCTNFRNDFFFQIPIILVKLKVIMLEKTFLDI